MTTRHGADTPDASAPAKPAKLSRERKRALTCTALAYAGDLVRNVVDSYTAFADLPEEEQTFIDGYLLTIGDRLSDQAKRWRERPKPARRR